MAKRQITVSLEESTLERLDQAAVREGRSRSNQAAKYIRECLEKDKPREEPKSHNRGGEWLRDRD